MATNAMLTGGYVDRDASQLSAWGVFRRILEPAASLKVTVALFAMSIFLILAGTFAQVDLDIWEVIGLYFRCWFAWIPNQVFFPPSFFQEQPWVVPGGYFFPGGKLLGLLLAINLISAHVVRFKVVAGGARLLAGTICVALGCLISWAIIAAGGNSKGIKADPLFAYSTQWIGYQGLLGLFALASGYGLLLLCQQPLARSGDKWVRQLFLRVAVGVVGILFLLLLGWCISLGEAGRPSDASLRILWQLTQGTVASIALLGGCWIVFGKRAGIVLLHGGIGLMMFYELHVALTAVETQMHLVEGERTNFVQDIRTVELAITDVTDSNVEKVVAIPKSLIVTKSPVVKKPPINHPDLPFTIQVSGFIKNARIRGVSSKDQNSATTGLGLTWIADSVHASTGTDSDSKVDSPAVYVTLTDKSDGKVLGTYLASSTLASSDEVDTVVLGGRTFQISLRPRRYYKPYVFELKDVSKKDYLGTNTPRSYASMVHIHDATRNVDEDKTIWMNNPLRFADETFYQSGYYQDPRSGVEYATLSVVANTGWMMPYVGCMLVGIGMLTHFLMLLVGYLTRGDVPDVTEEQAARAAELASRLGIKPKPAVTTPASDLSTTPSQGWVSSTFAAVMVLCAVAYFAMVATPPKPKSLSFDLYRFGQIPVVSEGRTKPLDSAATSALLAISGRTQVTVGEEESKQKVPAIQWLLEVIAEAKVADEREIFRVENLEVQETIGVKKREGMRYSRNEIRKHQDEFDRQVGLARDQAEKDRKGLSVYQKKILELSEKVSTFDNLVYAFGLQHRIQGETQQEVLRSFQMVNQFAEALEARGQPVFSIWPNDGNQEWHILSRAWLLDLPNRIKKNGEENPAVAAWEQILKSYSETKPAAFNQSVDQLMALINQDHPSDVKPSVIRLESYFNYVQPFTHAGRMYLVAFILGALGWLTWPRGFNRAAFYLVLVTLIVHTTALIARLVISGRPPVTNLYSSAVFIGWGCVVLGLLFEVIFRIGIGTLVAAVAGYATLLIADGLASDGDTFTVLQAVLDTQFWLATHVTCITLGYATTYLAGLFGIAYILRGVFTPSMTADDGRNINRMIYGTLCFSIFFSFVGTVLGGLWADDSWGRFWGWDPKENAALIIVLWNALALHARWGGMVNERGLAVLAVAGNIFVSWSWWGVNALGAGLHSYGFKDGTLLNLGRFILFNLVIIGIGMLPRSKWRSYRNRTDVSVTA